jgi:carboxyl-terminal processing protease
MFPLEGMGGFKLTVAEYFTPSGAQISGVGIKPNVRVEQEYVRLPGAVAYTRDMKKGTVGLDVLALQQALEFLGYNPGPADGVFGPRTEAAVIAFLRDYGRQYTGSVGQSEVSAVNGAVSDKGVNLPDNVLEEGIELLRQWIAMQ